MNNKIAFLLGKPAIGKTTLTNFMVENYKNCVGIKIGEKLRQLAMNDENIHHLLDICHGGYLPELSQIAKNIFQEIISQENEKLIIIDGYPRFTKQLNDVQDFLSLSKFFFITSENEEEIISNRLKERITNEKRLDDREEIFKKRIDFFEKDIKYIIKFAQDNSELIFIDANKNTEEKAREIYEHFHE